MYEELKYRVEGLENIIHGLHHNNSLMQFMSYNLHGEPYNLSNNHGLFWVWTNLMGTQILDFYKVIGKHEKFSFLKLINIAQENNLKVDFDLLEKATSRIIDSYSKTSFETVRSKYIAHQDLYTQEIKTDLISVDYFIQEIDNTFEIFCKVFEYQTAKVSESIIKSFSEIFSVIDDYERVKAYLIAAQIEGKTTVDISKLKELVSVQSEHNEQD